MDLDLSRDPLFKSRLKGDYERLLDNSFWQEFIRRVKEKTDQAEREPVHGPVSTPEGIGIYTAKCMGKYEAFRSVLGLPDVILTSSPPEG